MVSLSRQGNTSGAFFFDTEIPNDVENSADDRSLLHSSVIFAKEHHYRTYPVAGWIAVFIKFVVINVMLGLLFSGLACSILCMIHGGLWFILFLTSCVLHRCNGMMKRYGYLEFYRKTRLFIKLPFIIVSFGNFALLVLLAAMEQFCYSDVTCPADSIMHCRDYVMIIYCLEYIVHFPILIKCLCLLIRFQRAKALPDVQQDDLLISCIHSQSICLDLGLKDEEYKDEVLERQADMIRYLRQHNIFLSRHILNLTLELESVKTNST